MPKALVFSLPAAVRFQSGIALTDNWSKNLEIGGGDGGLSSILLGDVVYVFRSDETTSSPSIVIKISPGKLLECFQNDDAKLEVLRRAIDAGVLVLQGGGELPSYWRPFSGGKFVTFQATAMARRDRRRLVLWRRLNDAPCAYIFDVTSEQKDFDALNPDYDLLHFALENSTQALAMLPQKKAGSALTVANVLLGDLRGAEKVNAVTRGWKLSFLYNAKLTKKQREFVDAEMIQPIRLKGAAGTGKTLAMVTKLLWEAQKKNAKDQEYRFLFLTHNNSAAELAAQYASALDENDLLAMPQSEKKRISIDTLLGLALGELAEDLGDLNPISYDAHEGKSLQLMILSEEAAAYSQGIWMTKRRSCSKEFQGRLDAPVGTREHEEFCWDLMIELGSVLDADGVRDNREKRDAYVKESRRPKSLMVLDESGDREVVLDLYDRYRSRLRRERLISVDQLIADFLGYLDSFRWDARRSLKGYDAIFVDEYHLFNRLEKAAFVPLLRDAEGELPRILMALDPRQSPRALFLDAVAGEERALTRLSPGQAVSLRDFEFSEVFRYTEEIAAFLSFINQAFPEQDLSEEWLPGSVTSMAGTGEKPRAYSLPDQLTEYDSAIATAQELFKASGRGRVALLTLSTRTFDTISTASRYAKQLYVIDSRDTLSKLQYSGARVVFSMPEYVAGVQFDHVVVADVNELDDFGKQTSLNRARFGANLYLAASRARTSVTIYADDKSGGLAQCILAAKRNGVVEADES
ncbi:MAG TPA: UvrD-helicase domain-containing protein [Terriglobia bacterium]|nr:UvrD-helicase domain-containing protein [Terriglobia bacterium]